MEASDGRGRAGGGSRSSAFAFAVIDMEMPGTNGLDLTATLRRHPRARRRRSSS